MIMIPMLSILVDNNALSHPSLAEKVRKKRIYLSDAVFGELLSCGQWNRSITDCLAPLAPFAENVICSISLSEALNKELITGEPISSIDGDQNVNGRLPKILRACRDDPSGVIAYFGETQSIEPKMRSQSLNSLSSYRKISVDVVSRLRSNVDKSRLSKIRNCAELVPEFLKELNFRNVAIQCFTEFKKSVSLPCPEWDPKHVVTTSSCWMRYLLAGLCLAIRRSVKENFEKISDHDLHGDLIDDEIVIIATYADEFFTKDKNAKWLYDALRACLHKLF